MLALFSVDLNTFEKSNAMHRRAANSSGAMQKDLTERIYYTEVLGSRRYGLGDKVAVTREWLVWLRSISKVKASAAKRKRLRAELCS